MKHLFLSVSLCALAVPAAWSQSFCASDGQPTPLSLVERFISADCETCWSAPETSAPAPQSLVLDWIVPSERGDDAPLAAAASRDALMRLQNLKQAAPATSTVTTIQIGSDRANKLRVAHGVVLGDYIGASIELKAVSAPLLQASWSAWLVLVETIAAGSDGTPIQRNLVRNVFQPLWNSSSTLSNSKQLDFRELRPLNIPPGATPERLRVVGWVQDAGGRVLTAAQSVCVPDTR